MLDDPLAAVDAHVAAHLYQHSIQGLLKNKTVVLCTHHVKYLKDSDLIVVMNHGQIAHAGRETMVSQCFVQLTIAKEHTQNELKNLI